MFTAQIASVNLRQLASGAGCQLVKGTQLSKSIPLSTIYFFSTWSKSCCHNLHQSLPFLETCKQVRAIPRNDSALWSASTVTWQLKNESLSKVEFGKGNTQQKQKLTHPVIFWGCQITFLLCFFLGWLSQFLFVSCWSTRHEGLWCGRLAWHRSPHLLHCGGRWLRSGTPCRHAYGVAPHQDSITWNMAGWCKEIHGIWNIHVCDSKSWYILLTLLKNVKVVWCVDLPLDDVFWMMFFFKYHLYKVGPYQPYQL